LRSRLDVKKAGHWLAPEPVRQSSYSEPLVECDAWWHECLHVGSAGVYIQVCAWSRRGVRICLGWDDNDGLRMGKRSSKNIPTVHAILSQVLCWRRAEWADMSWSGFLRQAQGAPHGTRGGMAGAARAPRMLGSAEESMYGRCGHRCCYIVHTAT
jgi:hypothetical protein